MPPAYLTWAFYMFTCDVAAKKRLWDLKQIRDKLVCTRFTHCCTSIDCTCTDDLLDLDGGDVDLLGKFVDGLVGVFVGKGVDVDLHPR